jgi:hypothetical protein
VVDEAIVSQGFELCNIVPAPQDGRDGKQICRQVAAAAASLSPQLRSLHIWIFFADPFVALFSRV